MSGEEVGRPSLVSGGDQDLNGSQIGYGEWMDGLDNLGAEGAGDSVGLEESLDDQRLGLVLRSVDLHEATGWLAGFALGIHANDSTRSHPDGS